MDEWLIGSGIPAIQNISDLSQGLKPAIGGTVGVKAAGIDAVFERKEAEIELPATPV